MNGQRFVFDQPDNLGRPKLSGPPISLVEGSFEGVNSLEELLGRTPWGNGSNPAVADLQDIRIVTTDGYAGTHSVEFDRRRVTDPSGKYRGRLFQEVAWPLDSSDPFPASLVATAWAKGSIRGGSVFLLFQASYDVQGDNWIDVASQQIFDGNLSPTKWIQMQVRLLRKAWTPYQRVRVFIMADGIGTVQFDDVRLESRAVPPGLPRVLSTEAAPIIVTSLGGVPYKEGSDYRLRPTDQLGGVQLPFSLEVTRIEGGHIQAGAEVLVYYNYELDETGSDQAYSPREPRVRQIWEQVLEPTIAWLKPNVIHIGHDEVSHMGSDSRDGEIINGSWEARTTAELFAEEVTWVHNTILALNAHIHGGNHPMEVWMWGDMLDPYGNGYSAQPDAPSVVTLTNPTAAALEHIPKDIVILPWWYDDNFKAPLSHWINPHTQQEENPYYLNGRDYDFREHVEGAVRYFTERGFRIMGAPAHHWIRGAYVWADVLQKAQAYGMITASWATTWSPPDIPVRNVGAPSWPWYNWNTLITTGEFSWNGPGNLQNKGLDGAGWFYYDEIAAETPYYDANGNVITDPPSGSANFHRFNAKYGDIFVARPTGLRPMGRPFVGRPIQKKMSWDTGYIASIPMRRQRRWCMTCSGEQRHRLP